MGQILAYSQSVKILDLEILNTRVLNYSPYITFVNEVLIELHDVLTTHVLHPIKWDDNHKVLKLGFGPGSVYGTGHYGGLTSQRADDMETG